MRPTHLYGGIASAALFAVLISQAFAQPKKSAGENYAFLVAAQDYDAKELRPLKYTRRDVTEFAQVLLDSGFQNDNVVVMHEKQERRFQPEARKIREELKLLLDGLEEKDSIVVALSGHGVQFKGDKQGYYCPVDAVLSGEDRGTLISLAEIYRQLEHCKAARKLLLVDACRNDPQSDIKKSRAEVELESVTRPQELPVPKGMVAIFSCSAGQVSIEDPKLEHGVFFHHVLEGWRGKAVVGSDPQLTLDDLISFVKKRTQSYARLEFKLSQVPHQQNDFSGVWVLRDSFFLELVPILEKALAIVQGLPDSDRNDKDDILYIIAKAHAQAGQFAKALQTARLIGKEDRRSSALEEVANAYAKAGRFEEALQTARSVADKKSQATALYGVASAQIDKGRLDEALATARSFTGDVYHKGLILHSIAHAHIKAGKKEAARKSVDEGLQVARAVGEKDYRSHLLAYFARVESKLGRTEEAKRLFAEALQIARARKGEYANIYKDSDLETVASAQADSGLFTDAFQTVREIVGETSSKASALNRIAKAQHQQGLRTDAVKTFAEAIQAAKSMAEIHQAHQWTVANIAYAQADCGLLDDALQTARAIAKPMGKAQAFKNIAQFQFKAGQADAAQKSIEEALQAVRSYDVPTDRGYPCYWLGDLAGVQAEIGKTESAKETLREALQLARSLDGQYDKPHAFKNLAKDHAKLGLWQEALALVDEIQEPTYKAKAYAEIAMARISQAKVHLREQ